MRTNGDMMNLNLTRGEVCDLLIATTGIKFDMLDEMRDENTTESRKEVLKNSIKKWERLHDLIKDQLEQFDAQ